MNDGPVEAVGTGGRDPGMESRASLLEAAILRIDTSLQKLALDGAEVRSTLTHLATKEDVGELRGRMDAMTHLASKEDVAELRGRMAAMAQLASKEDLAELRGRMAAMPTTWVMITAVLGGQVTFAGIVLALLRMFRLH